MTFNNLNALLNHIEKDMQDVLENEVAEEVRNNMQDSIDVNVYNAYTPEYYHRRMENGGLADKDNMEATISGNVLMVRDVAPLDNGRTDYELDRIIVEGLGKQPFPRDFYGGTAERLEDNGDHIKAMKDGLRKRGYTVK